MTLGDLEKRDKAEYRSSLDALFAKYPVARLFASENLTSGGLRRTQSVKFSFRGNVYDPGIAKGNCCAADKKDAFLSPYYGIMLERLATAMSVGDRAGAELPKLETNRPPGTTADVDFMSRRQPVPVLKSHVNAVVADTAKWEQQTAFFIDTHPRVVAFVKNAGLGLGVPYTHEGQRHDYVPDFLVRRDDGLNIVLETKGFDRLADVKQQAAQRWVAAVNAHGGYGRWAYRMVRDPNAVSTVISTAT